MYTRVRYGLCPTSQEGGNMKLVMVEWIDSYSDTGWQHKSVLDSSTASECVSIGMMKEGNDCIKVYQSTSKSGNICDIIIIPRCAIKRIRKLCVKRD